MKMKSKNEGRKTKFQKNMFTMLVLSIAILFGVLTVENIAANETNQTNNSSNSKTTQTGTNNTTNGTGNSKNTSNTTSNTMKKNTTTNGNNTSNNSNTANTTNKTTTTKSSNANLSNLGIKPHDFSGFKAGTTSYKAVVPESTKTIEVYAKAQDAKAKVSGTGKKTLESGDNKVDVVVTAEDGTEKTYTIDIIRGEQEAENKENSGNGLSELKIGDLDLSPEFNTNVYEYTAKYIGEDTKLEMEAKPTDENYLVEVTGNENLQEGENTITILVSEKNGNNVATYQVTLNKSLVDEEAIAREEAEKKAKEQKTIIGIVVVVVILGAIIAFIILKHRKNQNIAEDYSGVSLYGKNNYDEGAEKEEFPKSLRKDKGEETTIGQEEKVEEVLENQGIEKSSEEPKQEDNYEKSDKEERAEDKEELQDEEEIENMPREEIKEKFLDHYSNYEENYEADSKGKKKKEKHKGKRFKE